MKTKDKKSIFILSILALVLICSFLFIGVNSINFKYALYRRIPKIYAMITNIYIYEVYNSSSDPTRLGAQVISGIGFLGAGTIIVTGKNKVRGLTTAAGLWACACMGLAIGAGFYSGAIIGCLFIASVTAVLSKLDKRINRNSRNITIYILVNSTKAASKLLKDIQSTNVKISDIEISNNNVSSNDLIGILLGLRIPGDVCHNDFIENITNKNEVIFLQEIN